MTYLTKLYMCMKTLFEYKRASSICCKIYMRLLTIPKDVMLKYTRSQMLSAAVFTELHSYTYSIQASPLVTGSLLACHLNTATSHCLYRHG